MKLIALILLTQPIFLSQTFCQQSPNYFDFWTDGKWESEVTVFNNDTIPEKDSFEVQKMKDKNAHLEDWRIYIGEGEYVNATVIRAFDKETNRWKLFYVDDLNAQTWDSKLVDEKLYFLKEFSFKGKKFYSRQAWSLRTDGTVLRTIDRSVDNQNWTSRYWQIFKKVN